MTSGFEPSGLLGRYHLLEGGMRLRLRLARSSDAEAMGRLVAAHGGDGVGFQTGSLVHYDPRRRCVICASALINSTETLVGVGVIELDGDDSAAPQLVIVDPRCARVADLLTDALVARGREAARARAA